MSCITLGSEIATQVRGQLKDKIWEKQIEKDYLFDQTRDHNSFPKLCKILLLVSPNLSYDIISGT